MNEAEDDRKAMRNQRGVHQEHVRKTRDPGRRLRLADLNGILIMVLKRHSAAGVLMGLTWAVPLHAQVIDIWSIFLNKPPSEETAVIQGIPQKFEIELSMKRVTLACDGQVELRYNQYDTVARVDATLVSASCPIDTLNYALVVSSKSSDGDVNQSRHEFSWNASAGERLPGSGEYPIGADTDLISVDARQLSCTCEKQRSVTVDETVDGPASLDETDWLFF